MTKAEIMKLAEFDSTLYPFDYEQTEKDGAAAENARLLPLISALAESNEKLVEALTRIFMLGSDDGAHPSEKIQPMQFACKAALTEHVERMKKIAGGGE